MKKRVIAVLLLVAAAVAVALAEGEGDGDLVAELVKMQEQSAGGVIHLDDASLQRYAARAKSRSYSLFIFFDAVQMRDNAELRLQDMRAEFQLMASSFIQSNPGLTKLFFCDLEFKESQASFVLMGVNSLPHIRLVGPGNANLKDSPAMDMSRGGTAESMAAFVEGQTGLRVGEIERPSPVSKKQLLFVGGVVLVAAPYVVKRLLTQQTPFHDPKLWLAFSIFVYFFSVSGAMYNIIRKMPLFMADRNDPSKLVFFYQGSGMQLGAEGFAVGFLYTVVGLVLAFVTHFLVYVRSQNMQRLLMLLAMALSYWAVKRVISLDNWKTGYAIHGFWPSA
ncbi:probable dolichyl-diphosphooligosaccharide--protein glycosyltransferase subunit 3B [Cryptomeria japonica]|nr:probable dolichyl-diphosphooligosaccharide--protein glycosyltransferase subunit 3B [Cryptomeria japonica]